MLKTFLKKNVDSFYLAEEKNTLVYVPSANYQMWDQLTSHWKYPLCVRVAYVSYSEENVVRVFIKYGNREIYVDTIQDIELFNAFAKRQEQLSDEIREKYLKGICTEC